MAVSSFGQRRTPPLIFLPPDPDPWWEPLRPWLVRLRPLAAQAGALASRLQASLGPVLAENAPPAVLPPRFAELRATGVRLLAYIGGITALAVVSAQIIRAPLLEAAIEHAPPRPAWIAPTKPHPAFEMTLPDLAEEQQYSILRNPEGGGRKDIISYGEPGRSRHYVMVEIYRAGAELAHFTGPASEIAARAAEFGFSGGLGGGVGASLPIDSKFGPASAVEFAAGRFGSGHCIGFARTYDTQHLQISGLYCSMDSFVERAAVVCALDRLTLLSSGSDPDIAKLFADAELKRTFCGQRDPILYATPKREYHGPPIPLKLRGPLSAR